MQFLHQPARSTDIPPLYHHLLQYTEAFQVNPSIHFFGVSYPGILSLKRQAGLATVKFPHYSHTPLPPPQNLKTECQIFPKLAGPLSFFLHLLNTKYLPLFFPPLYHYSSIQHFI